MGCFEGMHSTASPLWLQAHPIISCVWILLWHPPCVPHQTHKKLGSCSGASRTVNELNFSLLSNEFRIFHCYSNKKLMHHVYASILMYIYLYNRNAFIMKIVCGHLWAPNVLLTLDLRFRTCIIMPNPTYCGKNVIFQVSDRHFSL